MDKNQILKQIISIHQDQVFSKTKIDHHKPKVKSFHLEDPYNHANPIENNYAEIHLIYAHEKQIIEGIEKK